MICLNQPEQVVKLFTSDLSLTSDKSLIHFRRRDRRAGWAPTPRLHAAGEFLTIRSLVILRPLVT